MEATALKLQSLNYGNVKTYTVALFFIAGNILLPQLCHLVPKGGLIFLPIYFFTLVGAYKYGWKAGLLIAVFSPLINSALFGMPALVALPVIMAKSVLLAVAAGLAANRFKRISILILTLTVLSYQIAGTLVEWMMTGDFSIATQDFHIAVPGMLLQIFGGYAFVRYLMNNINPTH
jgi:hypothetical protein